MNALKKTKNSQLENYQHFINILQEKFNLYEKRQKETKKFLKASYRAKIFPSPYSIFIMLEAELAFFITSIGLQIFQEFKHSSKFSKKNNKNFTYTILIQDFKEKLTNIDNIPSYLSELCKKEFHIIINSLIEQDETKHRNLLKKFISNHLQNMLNDIFEKVIIVDEPFKVRLISQQKHYLEK